MMLISVCMPLFNGERYLASALDSVLKQSYPSVEIIVVDDGSTDASSTVLQDYVSRVRILKQANKGAAAARNAAWLASRGDLIMFMDADDIIGPDHIQALVEKVSNERSIASAPWARFYNDPNEAQFTEDYIENDVSGVEWCTTSMANGAPMTASGMFLLPRRMLEEFGGWNERLSLIDDFEFYTRIIARANMVRFAPGARLYYRSGIPGSLSRRKNRRAVESQFLSLMLGTGHLLKAVDNTHTRRACANVLQAFEYEHYPNNSDLRAKISARVSHLGGADIIPSGPPGFHKLRPWVGWKAARHVQRAAERLGLNGIARR